MSATGIGAAVRRKEDLRFVTGKGQYTDDVSRPGQTHIYFIRSPHAHARLKGIDTKAAAAMPGVVAVATGADFAESKLGGLICGWTVLSKDGSPMKMAPHPALAVGKACHVGDPVAVVIAETLAQAKDAAEKVLIDYEVLPAVVDPAKAAGKGAPQIHDIAPHNTIYNWHLGDHDATAAAFKAAKHVTKLDFVNNRLVPNAMEPRAALAEYDSGNESFTLWNTTPESARGAARDLRVCRHGARAQAAGDRARRRRRFRLEDLHLSGGGRLPLGVASKVNRPVKWTADRSEAFISDAHGRDHVTHAEMAFDADDKITGLQGATPSPISAPTCRPSPRRCRPISTRRCCRANTTSRTSIARSTRSTPTPCRSTPIAARGGRRRPSWSSAWWKPRARELGVDPADLRSEELRQDVPASDTGHHGL